MRGCREGGVKEDSCMSGLESERTLVPFAEMRGTQEEGPLRGVKCQVLLQACEEVPVGIQAELK